MSLSKLTGLTFLLSVLCSEVSFSQNSNSFTSVPLNNFDAFRDPGKNWIIAADAAASLDKPDDIKPVKGEGVILNTAIKNRQMNLVTKEEFGDLRLEMDFMMAKESNSGIYIQGKYEIQLLDSWTKLHPGSGDLGGIYKRYSAGRGTYEGSAPLMNVARAPGLWQHISVLFRAPKFDNAGHKTANARFEEVVINGIIVQQHTEVTGPTGYNISPEESVKGPILFQGDHGPVAFKNIKYKYPGPDTSVTVNRKSDWSDVNPIPVNPSGRPAFIKTFLTYGVKKLTHVLSVGDPSQANYSYDLKEGAIFQVWRGDFMDLTQAWYQRGEEQLGVPSGSVITLSDAPSVAILANENASWPDSVLFDSMHNKGYLLDGKRSPTFMYSYNGLDISDSIMCDPKGEFLSRTISIKNPSSNTYCRLAAGENIEKISDDLYTVNGKTYYVRTDKKFHPIIRKTSSGQELIVKYSVAVPVTYSIIW